MDIDEEVHMILEGKLVEMMVLIVPEAYRTYIPINKNGKPTLYVELREALYGCICIALLFWGKLNGIMIKDGFVLNLYNACVANRDINCSQCTIIWNVDDIIIFHKDPKVVAVLTWLEKLFGKLMIRRGKKHTYFGMDLDSIDSRSVKVSMVNYLKELIINFLLEIEGSPLNAPFTEFHTYTPDITHKPGSSMPPPKHFIETFPKCAATAIFTRQNTRPCTKRTDYIGSRTDINSTYI